MYCAFVDYEKAYDYLNRAAVFSKLTEFGASTKYVKLFKNMYSKIELMVRGDGENRYFMSNTGLLQGECTSPLLFSIFINDLESSINGEITGVNVQDFIIKLLMFADDLALFSETREGLQEGLNNLQSYCTKWGLTVNVSKTKVVVFRKGGRLARNDVFFYAGGEIEVVQSFKYLGCSISSGGSFKNCISDLVNSGRRALFALKRFYSKNPQTMPITKVELFNSLIKPILFYTSEIWGLQRADPIDKFFLAYLKTILRVKASTTNAYVYGEFGLFPFIVIRKLVVVKYWVKILSKLNNRESFISKVYRALYDYSLTNPNKTTWVTLVRDMLYRIGFGNYWQAQNVGEEKHFIAIFKQRIEDIYHQEWRGEVENSTDARLYKHIKEKFEFEPYLNIANSTFRTAISKIRLSSHNFLIERGRWGQTRIERQNRRCAVCATIEDEFHCLIECPLFVNERKGCLSDALKRRKSMYEFINFLKSKDMGLMIKLGKLCHRVHSKYRDRM